MAATDLEMILAWRNDPAVRGVMRTRHEITASEHRRWYLRASADAARRLWVYQLHGRMLGFVQFAEVCPGGQASWGFYSAPGAPKGIGRAMGRLALDRIFGEEGVAAVTAEVMADNLRSLAMHEALGFAPCGEIESTHQDSAGRTIMLHRVALDLATWSKRRACLRHHHGAEEADSR